MSSNGPILNQSKFVMHGVGDTPSTRKDLTLCPELTILLGCVRHGLLAQLVEQRTLNP